MRITVTLNASGIYLVEYLGQDFNPISTPSIPEVLVQSTEVSGLHKIYLTVPDGSYTIPYIKITGQTDGYKTVFIRDHRVLCVGPPVPTPVPVFSPVPIYTPVTVTPVACDCILVTMTPTGIGPDAKWTVYYTDCDGVSQSTSGNGLDAPRLRYVCRVDTVSSSGQVSITYSMPVPTPTQTPVPIFSCVCKQYRIGLPSANWGVNYTDCNGVVQQLYQDYIPYRNVCACEGSVTNIFGDATISVLGSCAGAPTPTPTPTPTPAQAPTPVYVSQGDWIESTGFRVSFSNGKYSDTNPTPPSGYKNYYFINEYPLVDNASNPLPFTQIDLSSLAGRMVMLRKLVLKTATFANYNSFLANGFIANLPDATSNILSNSQIIIIP